MPVLFVAHVGRHMWGICEQMSYSISKFRSTLLVGAPGLSKMGLVHDFVFPPGALVRLLFNQGNGPGEEEGGGFTCRTPV